MSARVIHVVMKAHASMEGIGLLVNVNLDSLVYSVKQVRDSGGVGKKMFLIEGKHFYIVPALSLSYNDGAWVNGRIGMVVNSMSGWIQC